MKSEIDRKQLRSFGWLVGGIFALIGLWPALLRGEDLKVWAIVVAGLLTIPALVLPKSLRPLYKIWMTAGHILGWINTRIILSIIFYGLFTPMGLVMRLFGKDPMRRQFESAASTYRITRQPRPSSHMRHQF